MKIKINTSIDDGSGDYLGLQGDVDRMYVKLGSDVVMLMVEHVEVEGDTVYITCEKMVTERRIDYSLVIECEGSGFETMWGK